MSLQIGKKASKGADRQRRKRRRRRKFPICVKAVIDLFGVAALKSVVSGRRKIRGDKHGQKRK